jgi:hypothetical protein
MDVMDVLLRERLWFIVSGEDTGLRESALEETVLHWKERRAKASATLRLLMLEKVRARYKGAEYVSDPASLWKKIEEDHKDAVALDEDYLRNQLFELRLEDSGTVADYLAVIDKICDNLDACGSKITDKDRRFYVLHGLPRAWSVYAQILRNTIKDKKTATLTSQLLGEEARLKREKGLGPDTTLFTRRHNKWTTVARTEGQQQQGGSSQYISTIECFYYHRISASGVPDANSKCCKQQD